MLATAWQLTPLLILNAMAPHLGWWSFVADGGLWWGVPVDRWWDGRFSGAPTCAPAAPDFPIWIGIGAFLLDLLVIPFVGLSSIDGLAMAARRRCASPWP